MSAEPQPLLHVTHARQDEAWVQGVLIPALGLSEGQYWTRAEDDLGALKLDELERAVKTCRYTLLVASSAARVDQWVQFAGLLAEHLGIEEGKPRLLLVTRDFVPGSKRARRLLSLRQQCLTCLDCSSPERTTAALAMLAAQLAVTTTEAPPTECPYPGLRMFGAGDPVSCFHRTDLFFGRDEEGRAIVERLRAGEHVLLMGPSGCGKSSLVRARVLPALGQGSDAMPIVVARPGAGVDQGTPKPHNAQPDVVLRAALDALDPRLSSAIDAYLDAEDQQAALPTLLAAAPGPRRLVYLDHLEEVFLDQADERGERARFFARLAALGRVPGVAILLVMRADFYSDLMRSSVWDDFKDHRFELAPLRGPALRLAITRPAEVVGVHVEADLVERLVREADQDRAAEALPLLQVVLEQLWTQREWRYLSLASYERIADGKRRGLDVVFAHHADLSIKALHRPARALARRILVDLVHLAEGRPDTRRRRRENDLRRDGDNVDAVIEVLAHLSARRLIVTNAEAPGSTSVSMVELRVTDVDAAARHFDLAHDTLITGWPMLAGWISERRKDVRTQRRIEARAAGGGLLTVVELVAFTSWLDSPAGMQIGVSKKVRDVVRRSIVARRVQRAVFAIGLVAATGFAIVFGLQAWHLREETARTQRSISEAAKAAEALVSEAKELETVAGASSMRESLLKRARALLAELRELGDLGERVPRTTWNAKMEQADIALEHGHSDEATRLYLVALLEARWRTFANPNDHEWKHDLSVAHQKLGNVAVSAGELRTAQFWFEKALEIDATFAAASAGDIDRKHDLLVSYNKLGDIAVLAGNFNLARNLFHKALEIENVLADADPTNATWQHDLAVTYGKLGDAAVSAGNLDDAKVSFDKALAVIKPLADAAPASATWRHDLAAFYGKLGNVAVSAGEPDDARDSFNKALSIAQALIDADRTNTTWQRDLAVSYESLGNAEVYADKLDDARNWFEKALEVRLALVHADPTNTTWKHDLAVVYNKLGDLAVKARELDAARDWFENALRIHMALAITEPTSTRQHDLAVVYNKLGDLAAKAGRLDDGRDAVEKAFALNGVLTDAGPADAEPIDAQ